MSSYNQMRVNQIKRDRERQRTSIKADGTLSAKRMGINKEGTKKVMGRAYDPDTL